jgi:uncharacterized protein YeaO (DUF488 family)
MEKEIPYLKTKSIHAPASPEDGHRISIMSRHTLNDGITPDPLITQDSFNDWIRELAPPDNLIGSLYKRNLPWGEFEKQYLEFLKKPNVQIKVRQVIDLAKTETVTLLCVEEEPQHCHRRLLAEECQKIDPTLVIKIN